MALSLFKHGWCFDFYALQNLFRKDKTIHYDTKIPILLEMYALIILPVYWLTNTSLLEKCEGVIFTLLYYFFHFVDQKVVRCLSLKSIR